MEHARGQVPDSNGNGGGGVDKSATIRQPRIRSCANSVHSSTHPGADAPSSESFVSKSMKPWSLTAVATAAFLACGPAAAQFKNADDAIEYRQGALTVMDHHFASIGAMVSGETPFDAKVAQANADLVVTLARLPWGAFVEGSDKGDTNARPEVWAQPGKFKAAAGGCRTPPASSPPPRRPQAGRPEGRVRRDLRGLQGVPRRLPQEALN